MAEPSPLKRSWLTLRELPGRTPLRVKLVTAVLALVAVALAVISIVGISQLQRHLLTQYDNTLQSYADQAGRAAGEYVAGANPSYSSQGYVIWVPSGGKPETVLAQIQGFHPATGFPSQPPTLPAPQVPADSAWLASNNDSFVTVPAQSGGGSWRLLVESASFGTPNGGVANGYVIVAVDVTSVYSAIGQLTSLDLIVSALLLLIILIVGIAVVRASLRPLTDIEKTAGAIAAGDLTRRVPDLDPRTEVGRLGQSLNAMLTQIETAFDARAESEFAARRSEERMRQFVADASHELRTPLTAIRGYAEYYRQRGGVSEIEAGHGEPAPANGAHGAVSPLPAVSGQEAEGPLDRAELDRIMQRVEQESSRMGVLVEDMLLLARLDQQRPLERGTVDMLTLAADAVNDARVIAPDRSINLTVGSGAALLVVGDEVRLRQVIGNLMSNALNHTPDGTPIETRVRLGDLDEWRVAAAKAGRAEIAAARPSARPTPAVVFEVADQGPGLTPEQASHVFERFYRGEKARTRKAGGTGLGLSIVAALVGAHGGAVWVESPPGGGAIFHIAIPLAPEARYSSAEPDDGTDPGVAGPPALGDGPGRAAGPGSFPGPAGASRPGRGPGTAPGPAPGFGASPSPGAGSRPGAFSRAWRTSAHPRRGEAPAPRPFPAAPPPPPPPGTDA
jgi:two-component system, OmpR family, sensor kinase